MRATTAYMLAGVVVLASCLTTACAFSGDVTAKIRGGYTLCCASSSVYGTSTVHQEGVGHCRGPTHGLAGGGAHAAGADGVLVNGRAKDMPPTDGNVSPRQTETVCASACNDMKNCYGYSYQATDEETGVAVRRCYLHGPGLSEGLVPLPLDATPSTTQWEGFAQPNAAIATTDRYPGVVCKIKNDATSAPSVQPTYSHSHAPTQHKCGNSKQDTGNWPYVPGCDKCCHGRPKLVIDTPGFGYPPVNGCMKFGEYGIQQYVAPEAKALCDERPACDGWQIDEENKAVCFCGHAQCPGNVSLPGTSCMCKDSTGAPTTAPTLLPTAAPTTGAPTTMPTHSPTRNPTPKITIAPTTDECKNTGGYVEYVSTKCKCQNKCETIFGTIQTARNVFVLDLSGSMGTSQPNGQSRLLSMKQELQNVLGNLTEHQYYLLITFSDTVQVSSKGWQQATAYNVGQTRAVIEGWKANGQTNTLAALQAAVAHCNRSTAATTSENGIYLLSDGSPDLGQGTSSEESQEMQAAILSQAKGWNISVSTIAWVQGGCTMRVCGGAAGLAKTKKAASAFMKSLATETGGNFGEFIDGNSAEAVKAQSANAAKVNICKKKCTTLFGSIQSPRVVFVVDISGSMNQFTANHKSRLEDVQQQLTEQVLTHDPLKKPWGLGPSQSFAIVTFSRYARCWPTDPKTGKCMLMRADAAGKDAAINWIRTWSAGGVTNTYDALRLALAIPKITKVILLSDGVPTSATGQPLASLPKTILSDVQGKSFNPGTTQIRTILFTEGGVEKAATKAKALAFMDELALRTDARCSDCTCSALFGSCQECNTCPVVGTNTPGQNIGGNH